MWIILRGQRIASVGAPAREGARAASFSTAQMAGPRCPRTRDRYKRRGARGRPVRFISQPRGWRRSLRLVVMLPFGLHFEVEYLQRRRSAQRRFVAELGGEANSPAFPQRRLDLL